MRDLFYEEMLAARRLAESLRSPVDNLRKQMALAGIGDPNGPVQQMIEQARRDEAMRRSLIDQDTVRLAIENARQWQEQDQWRKAMGMPSLAEEAMRAAELAQRIVLPDPLAEFRTTTDALALKLAQTRAVELWREPAYMAAFGQASAMADFYAESQRVSLQLAEAHRTMMLAGVPVGTGLADYRGLLDAAGLVLPRWPRVRLLSKAEKRRRFRARLQRNAEPPHIKRAKSLVHRYELTMREILDAAMAETYGEDWAEERLPLCDCKDLLGKWRRRGGAVLDHADYAHYARIMSHPEHFAEVFEVGFEDRQELHDLMVKAGRLRAASHHPHVFTPEDLRDLRLTWRTIETGLNALCGDYVVEF